MPFNQSFLTKPQQSIILANAIIHFDNALYSYLVPVIAPLFFPNKELVTQLILGYSILPITAFIARSFGMFFFSKMAQIIKETTLLRYTLLGATVSLIALGCLPTYAQASLWSSIGLIVARMCIETSAAGEHHIARIYLLKGAATNQAKQLAAWYEISTMVGIIGAGVVGTWLAWINNPEQYWRLPFFIAGIVTLSNGLLLRARSIGMDQSVETTSICLPIYLYLWQERHTIVRIAVVTGFSYATYTIPTLFMNTMVPMVSTITYPEMMQYTTLLMIGDLGLLGFMGKFCKKYDSNTLMVLSSGLVAFSIIPLFGGLQGASLWYVTLVRCLLIFLGVAFSCFLIFWSKAQVATQAPYLIIGCATVLGSTLIGQSAVPICFYLFQWFNSPIAPACYIALLALVTTRIVAKAAINEK